MMEIEDIKKNGLEVGIGSKTIRVKGEFVGNLFCVDRASIDNNASLTEREKDYLIKRLQNDRNILVSQ